MRHAVMLGSRRLSYLEAGDPAGRVLVLLHAFPLTAQMWLPQLLAPPDGWRLIAPDLAGLGSTDDHESEPPVLDDYVCDTTALLDRLEIRRAHVGGLSLGGYVALAVARLASDRVDGLVLADTKAPADTAEQRAVRDRLIATLDAGGPMLSPLRCSRAWSARRRDASSPKVLAEVRAQIRTEWREGHPPGHPSPPRSPRRHARGSPPSPCRPW